MKKLLVALCILALGVSAQAQTAKKKTVKKTVTTTTEEIDENGKKTIKTEKVETDEDSEAVQAPAPVEPTANITPPDGLPTINESWYTLWGLGFSKANYSGNLGDAYEKDGDTAGVDRSSTINLDLVGFYKPLSGHKTMIGFIINTAGDSMEDTAGNKQSMSTALFGFSAHHFFGKNIGDGWFLRGDVGLAFSSIDFDFNSVKYDDTSDVTIGTLLGGGYGFPLGYQTRLLVGLYVRPLPKLKYNNNAEVKGTVTNFTVGFLF